jgi:hypothetical protein
LRLTWIDQFAMLVDGRIDELSAMSVQRRKRASFICTHQARITDAISGYDSRQSSLGPLRHFSSVAAATWDL